MKCAHCIGEIIIEINKCPECEKQMCPACISAFITLQACPIPVFEVTDFIPMMGD